MPKAILENAAPPDLARDAGEYWAASDNDARVQDMSHWRGHGRWADERLWMSWGKSNIERFRTLMTLVGKTSIESMLEWGPGGGCNAIHFIQYAKQIYGVDVSSANLRQCETQLRANKYYGFTPIAIDAENPELVLEQVDRPVDFFLCTAVFQHFPSQEYGRRVTEIAHRVLADDGIALIQTRYDDGSDNLKCKDADYQKNVATFTSYRIETFWDMAKVAGFEPLTVSLVPSTKYAFYMLRKG